MEAKDFRNVLYFMCNHWDENTCSMIFNGFSNYESNYLYSIGWHVWNKWIEGINNHYGALNSIAWFMLELDNECTQKIIDKSLEYYKSN